MRISNLLEYGVICNTLMIVLPNLDQTASFTVSQNLHSSIRSKHDIVNRINRIQLRYAQGFYLGKLEEKFVDEMLKKFQNKFQEEILH